MSIYSGTHKSIPVPPNLQLGLNGVYQYLKTYYSFKNGRLEWYVSQFGLELCDGFRTWKLSRQNLEIPTWVTSYYEYGFLKSETVRNFDSSIVSEMNMNRSRMLHGRQVTASRNHVLHYENGYLSGPFECHMSLLSGTILYYTGNYRVSSKQFNPIVFDANRQNIDYLTGIFTCITMERLMPGSNFTKQEECARYNSDGKLHGPQITRKFIDNVIHEDVTYRINGTLLSQVQYYEHYFQLDQFILKTTNVCNDIRHCIVAFLK